MIQAIQENEDAKIDVGFDMNVASTNDVVVIHVTIYTRMRYVNDDTLMSIEVNQKVRFTKDMVK